MSVDINFFTDTIRRIEQTGVVPENIDVFLPTLITTAVANDNKRTLNAVMDYLEVPEQTADGKTINLKERLILYQFGNTKQC